MYEARCENGVVTSVFKIASASNYWPDLWGLPDLYTTAPYEDRAEPENKYSPRDYDSAEDWEADTGGSIEEWDRH